MPLLPQAFLTNFHIFIPSTLSVFPPHYLTTVTVPHQQNLFELSHRDHVCVLHSFELQVSGGFAHRLLSDNAKEGERRGHASSLILEVD